MTADVHFNCFTTCLFFQNETKIKFLEGNQKSNFRWELKQKFQKEIKYFKRKSRQNFEGKQDKNFRRKPKQKF